MPPPKPRRVRRGRPRRSGKPRILILCEGAKTEPNYFAQLKQAEHLTSVFVRPPRRKQIGPAGLLRRLREELEEDSDWDEVHCVLDHDGRDTEIREFRTRLAAINQKSDTQVKMILSVPCFEFWLLLHFEFTDRPFVPKGGRTACDDVIKKLRRHLSDYRKNNPQTFRRCHQHMNTAIQNAAQLESERPEPPQPGPSYTNVGSLMKRLLRISENKRT